MSRMIAVKQAVGVASIGLGLAALLFPRRFSRMIGIDEPTPPEAVAAFGSRELANGAALLAPVKFGPFLWMRVAGDVMDLAGLGVALRKPETNRKLVGIAAAVVAAIMVFDVMLALQDQAEPETSA